MKEFGIIVQTKEFEEGDIICHINNWNIGIPMFGKATDNDVEKYSGKNGVYLKIIQTSKLDLVNKPVETTNEQPIDFNKLSKIKQELLLSCYYALQCIDDSKVKPLEIDIEEECAVTTRRTIEIRVGSIDFGVKVNNIDVIDKNIEW